MKKWTDKINEVKQNERKVKVAIMSANNRYAGFGSATVNTFRETMEMLQVSYDSVDMRKFPSTKDSDD